MDDDEHTEGNRQNINYQMMRQETAANNDSQSQNEEDKHKVTNIDMTHVHANKKLRRSRQQIL